MSTNSLCFKEAFEAWESGDIDLEEYLRHIVAHYSGLRHAGDIEGQRPYIYGGFGFLNDVRNLVLSDKFQPLDDDSKYIFATISSPLS